MLVISIPAAPENNIEETARAVSLQLIAVGTRHCRLLRLLRLLRLYHSDANGFDINSSFGVHCASDNVK